MRTALGTPRMSGRDYRQLMSNVRLAKKDDVGSCWVWCGTNRNYYFRGKRYHPRRLIFSQLASISLHGVAVHPRYIGALDDGVKPYPGGPTTCRNGCVSPLHAYAKGKKIYSDLDVSHLAKWVRWHWGKGILCFDKWIWGEAYKPYISEDIPD